MIDYHTIAIIIEVYSWIVAAVIVAFIGGVGLFYQKKFNVNTHYYLFLIPLFLLIFLVLSSQIFMHGSLYTNICEALGGLMSLILTAKLYFHMTGVD